MSTDNENKNIGYLLGRLFAILEKIQGEATHNINSTIRDRFYGSASSTPVVPFSGLMRLKNCHLSKLPKGREVFFEKLLGEVVSNIRAFPAHLSLAEQGEFAIGYYHQRHDFYSISDEKKTN